MTESKTNFWTKIGKSFKTFFNKIKVSYNNRFHYMNTLVVMQLKDKIDFSYLKEKKKTFFKTIWTILLFILVTAVITIFFELVIKLSLFSYLQILNFRAFLILMTVIFLLSFISCLVNVTTTLYFAKDNPVLLTMPVKSSTVFTSKMIVCFIYELLKNFNYILPFMLAYGIVMHLSVGYFFWVILSVIFLTFLFVILSGLLSIPAMAITIGLKKHKTLEISLLVTFVGLLIFGIVVAITHIPGDIDIVRDWGKIYISLQNILNGFARIFLPIDFLLQLLTGMSYNSFVFTPFNIPNLITFGVCIGLLILSWLAIYFLSKPLFLKMASSPFEYRNKTVKKVRKNSKKKALYSSAVQQSKRIFRTANLIYSILAVAIISPIAILFQNKIISVMDTRLTGEYMGISFNILIILLLALSTNNILASIFSREGNSAYLNKVNPVDYKIPLTGKLILNALIFSISIIISTFVIKIFSGINIISILLLAFSMIFIYLGHLFWSAELDIMNPQNRQYQTTGKSQKNPNETKSVIIGFLMSIIFALVAFFLMSENINTVFIKLFFISLVVFIVRLHIYFTKIKLYYKEKAV